MNAERRSTAESHRDSNTAGGGGGMGDGGGGGWSLKGDWLVRAPELGEWRTVGDPALDDSGWRAASGLGRWWLDPALADRSEVLYRHRFRVPAEIADRLEQLEQDASAMPRRSLWPQSSSAPAASQWSRWWLVVDGLCDLGHVWFDGAYLGDLRGRHRQHAFEVTGRLSADREHLVAVEASHGPEPRPQHADAAVLICQTGPARITRVRVLVIEAEHDRAVLRVAATVDSSGTHRGELTTTVTPTAGVGQQRSDDTGGSHSDGADTDGADSDGADSDGADTDGAKTDDRQSAAASGGLVRSERVLARGHNELEWLVALERPALWWPASMGEQTQYCVSIEAAIGGQRSDAARLATGIRTVTVRRDRLMVNGVAHPDGLDALNIAERELGHRHRYAAADAAGELLCQQVSFEPSAFAGAERGLRALAARACAAAADHAGHHPCVAVWQPVPTAGGAGRPPWPAPWSDHIMSSAMRAADPTRLVLRARLHQRRASAGWAGRLGRRVTA